LDTKPIVLKLGGSAITDKTNLKTARPDVIERLAQEISDASISRLVIVHGGGSFGHPFAEKYRINDGYKNASQIIGFAETHEAMTELNKMVVEALIRHNIPAVSIAPSSFIVTKRRRIEKLDINIIAKLLDMKFVPILYGDAVLDSEQGFAILSGDQLITQLAIAFGAERIVIGVGVDGFYTADPSTPDAKLIPRVSLGEMRTLLNRAGKSEATDVTGGMKQKIIELIPAIEHGIHAVMVNAATANNIRRTLRDQPVRGTVFIKE